jgi:hypothetical protein
MGGPSLPDVEPDLRQGWVEKWLYLAAEDAEARRAAEESEASSNGADGFAASELARRLGAVEKR